MTKYTIYKRNFAHFHLLKVIFDIKQICDFSHISDSVVRFVLYDLTKPHVPSSSEQLDHVDDLVQVQHGGFTLGLLDSLFSKGLRTVKSIPPKCRLGFSQVLKEALDKIRDSFSLSLHAWYLDDGTIVGDTMVVGKVLELIMEDGPGCGMHLNVDKTEVFWPKEDPRSRIAGIFPPNIARPFHGVKLLGGPASVDFDFCNELVMKRVAKTIGLMDDIAKINDPQCDLLLLHSCTGISRLYFTMRTCPPCVFESAQRSFDVALHSSLERIVTASGPGFSDWKWRLATLPFAFGGLGVYSTGDVLNYAFLASRLQSAGLQTKILRYTSIVSPGPIFDEALSVFNTSMETDLLSNPSEIVAPKLMKKMADIYFTQDHTSDWLRTVPISGLGQTMNACSRFFAGDIYGDYAVSCAGSIGIKHRHNVVRDTLVDICYRSGISAGKEVDIGLDGGRDKPLRLADISKRGKYMAKCAAIGYGFLPFSFFSLGELEADAVTLLKQIRKFSVTQDIGARAVVHIFNRISFAIAKGPPRVSLGRLLPHARGLRFESVRGGFPSRWESVGFCPIDVSIRGWQGLPSRYVLWNRITNYYLRLAGTTFWVSTVKSNN
ncbi:hypothetical protein Tco_0590671 [Tanacetum coccineum]